MNKQRRYLSIHEGLMKQRMNTPDEVAYNSLSKVHLLHISFQVIRKDKNDPNSEVIGDVIAFHLVDKDDYFILQTWLNSIYAKCFFNLMENVDWNKEVTIVTSQKIVDGKKKGALFIRQDGNIVKWKYTNGNMQDCPPVAVTVAENGTKHYDNTEQEAFFLVKLDKWLMPELAKKPCPFPDHPLIYTPNTTNQNTSTNWVAGANTQALPVTNAETSGAEDDLPF